jgi:Ca-activated chloride channel family protein
MHALLTSLAVALAAAHSTPAPALDDTTRAPHFVIPLVAGEVDPLPLESVESDVRVAGVIAEVTLKQTWRNRGTRPLEATYVFPTSTKAAVHAVTMRIDDRVLHAKIDRKSAARATYEAAKTEGKSAALLEQHRDDVLQMSVANILPGDVIEVLVHYSELLLPKNHVYSVVIPAVVGPRYLGGEVTPDDAHAFTNPTLREGAPVPYRWKSKMHISSPLDIKTIGSPTHAISPRFTSRTDVDVALDDTGDSESGARDLVVRYVLGGSQIDTGVLLFRDREHGENYFVLLAEPPLKSDAHAIPPREIVFIVDVSGSMGGEPTETARDTMRALLDTLGPKDRFNVLTFASGSQLYATESVPPTPEHRARALRFHEGSPTGGTELDAAVTRALALPRHSPMLSRSFVLITDGYVAADRAVLRSVRDHLDEANIFVFGVGSSVNRGLLENIARAGRGEPFYALHRASAAAEVARFTDLVSRPALTNLKVTFEHFDAYDLEPAKLPDLFADRPIVLFGKYRDGAGGRIVVEGQNGDGRFHKTIAVEDHRESEANGALRVLWARHRLHTLLEFEDQTDANVEEATALALEHDLLSRFTSFVVVDDVVRTTERNATVRQPLPLPAGVTNGAVGPVDGLRYGARSTIDFSDVSIEGELKKPEGSYLFGKKATKSEALVKPRENFHVEMLESAGELGGSEVFGVGGLGSGYGTASGAGGLGLRGSGRGGGGNGLGSIGSSSGGISQKSDRSFDLGGRGKGMSGIRPGQIDITSTRGALDKEVIRRVVRESFLAQAKYCVEKERSKSAARVVGRIVLVFEIGADGTVKRLKLDEDTLGSEEASACLEKKAKLMRFPKPVGGGRVNVRYPLQFGDGEETPPSTTP